MATRVKEKTLALQQNKDKRPVAHARHIRISPYKVRTVLDIVRGLPVNRALATLKNMPRGASEVVYKLVASAVANAENNHNLDADALYIAEIHASQGPTLKRMLPKAKGSSSRILKRTSHLTVRLDDITNKGVVDVKSTSTTSKSSTKNTTTKKVDSKPKAQKSEKKVEAKPAKAEKSDTKPVKAEKSTSDKKASASKTETAAPKSKSEKESK